MAAIIAVVVVGVFELGQTEGEKTYGTSGKEVEIIMLLASLQGVGIVSNQSYGAIKLESEKKSKWVRRKITVARERDSSLKVRRTHPRRDTP
jgi:hypothetical protein